MTKSQKIIIAAIAAATVAAGAAIWVFTGPSSGTTPSHADHEGPGHGEHDQDRDDYHDGAPHADAPDQVQLTAAQIQASGLQTEPAGPVVIMVGAEFQGEVRFDADRTAQVVPRVAGVVEQVNADLGQKVRRGEVLAVVSSPELSSQRAALLAARERAAAARATYQREKTLWEQKISAQQDYLAAQQQLREAEIEQRNAEQRLSAVGASLPTRGAPLSRYEIRAPFDGTIVEKDLALGETVASDAKVFVVADLSRVWVAFFVPASDIEKVRTGAIATVRPPGSGTVVQGTVSHVGSLLGASTRSATARLTLPNPQGAWRPGLFVSVEVEQARAPVPVAVRNEAIQTIENRPGVFVRSGEGFRFAPLRLGRADAMHTEVLGGLNAGDAYASRHSFILKAELGKGSAEHAH